MSRSGLARHRSYDSINVREIEGLGETNLRDREGLFGVTVNPLTKRGCGAVVGIVGANSALWGMALVRPPDHNPLQRFLIGWFSNSFLPL
jgi:hypothetical protein